MTIQEAVNHLLQSDSFKEEARQDSKLRVFLGRWNRQKIKNGAAIEVLLKFGYKVEVKNPKSKSVTVSK